MKGSSGNRSSAFVGLHLPSIVTLLRLLNELELASSSFVERRYSESAVGFKTTLRFLTTLGIVQEGQGQLTMAQEWRKQSIEKTEDLAPRLVNTITSTKSLYRLEVFEYLRRFEVKDTCPEYRPDLQQRSAERAVRNFMIELGIVCYDREDDRYYLPHDSTELYALAICGPVMSSARLRTNLQRKEEIGLAAETAVLAYEKERVGPQFAEKVAHVAATNVAAGYDLQSISVCGDGSILPRYIEVKAVSREAYRFFWTSNEQKAARAFGPWYYLYLVPIGKAGDVDLQGLLIVGDPLPPCPGESGEMDCGRRRASMLSEEPEHGY